MADTIMRLFITRNIHIMKQGKEQRILLPSETVTGSSLMKDQPSLHLDL